MCIWWLNYLSIVQQFGPTRHNVMVNLLQHLYWQVAVHCRAKWRQFRVFLIHLTWMFSENTQRTNTGTSKTSKLQTETFFLRLVVCHETVFNKRLDKGWKASFLPVALWNLDCVSVTLALFLSKDNDEKLAITNSTKSLTFQHDALRRVWNHLPSCYKWPDPSVMYLLYVTHTLHVSRDAVGLGQLILEPTCRSILPQLTRFYSWKLSLQSRPPHPFPACLAWAGSDRTDAAAPTAKSDSCDSALHNMATDSAIWVQLPSMRPHR